ncbi:hypothetical protein SAMN03159355_01504 [Pseudomonas sp. NFPP10]|uniref:hypothetical protein n=1 Tax=unclassified Pseudomonas TaxID=196821 RepID=UPI000883F37C|nr:MULTISPECIES: hypothetical protein [unclassified Pseudomonas]SDA18114.1 hypothetical protein SAMN03159465_01972 [Pseudomonas sp. NFPP12]SEK98307.1 hypothetical protein SAMN03159355_01504 [Pseudomonas sp. NFPP10]SFI57089.1 hypothetical protein SAMN03159416_01922 [Pseudomonas sp. NFPP08]SFM42558.1 hypothetical protein SAMN03159476_01554 [Pseudomonas sp. NFPP05]SFX30999.1 hypothetical protein SAMN03159479_01504 [Pseudomonas sp. NFPP09]
MQKIGASTASANALGEFTEGNPGAGVDATLLKAAWLNAIQRELVHIVEGAGMSLDAADDSQLLKAIQAIQAIANTWSKLNGKPTTIAGFGITDAYTKQETKSEIQARVADLVASSPAALDTLKELADALGNDPNFAATMTSELANKAAKATTLSGYGITDAYTKTLMDNALSGKAAKATTLSGYGITDAYTKTEADAAIKAQATETQRGAVRIATITEMNAGVDDSAALTAKKAKWGFAISIGENGYIAFPSWLGRFVVQWGTTTAASVTFPLQFSAISHLDLKINNMYSNSSPAGTYTNVSASSTTGFSVTSAAAGTGQLKWLAFGNY